MLSIYNATIETPEVEVMEETTTETHLQEPWRVILYNDDIHSFDEVIFQLMKAVGCTYEWGEEKALEVHTRGKACVYEGEFEDCFRIQVILQEIQLMVEIQG